MKTFTVTLFICAAALLPWLLPPGMGLRGQKEVRNWATACIRLDVLEVAGLATPACSLSANTRGRRSP